MSNRAIKLSPKQEAFALGISEGKTQSDAYRAAYPSSLGWKPETVWSRASELRADGKVSERINQLMASTAERNAVTQDELVSMARKAYAIAEQNGESTAMTQATMAIARITGHVLTKPPEPDRGPIRLLYVRPEGEEAIEGEFTEVEGADDAE